MVERARRVALTAPEDARGDPGTASTTISGSTPAFTTKRCLSAPVLAESSSAAGRRCPEPVDPDRAVADGGTAGVDPVPVRHGDEYRSDGWTIGDGVDVLGLDALLTGPQVIRRRTSGAPRGSRCSRRRRVSTMRGLPVVPTRQD